MMSYNHISMDDDGAASFVDDAWKQNCMDENMDSEKHRCTTSIGGVSIIEPTMTPGEFIRRCMQQYYFEFLWQVPFPQVPAVPLLYIPEVLKELLRDPAPLGVMQAELDAMSDGVLERIPLAYYLLSPEVVEETRRISIECEQRVEEMQRQAIAAGLPEIFTWRPEEVNPYLEQADAMLLDTDIDLNLVLQRDKPSLTLLQRPLYTDMGMVPQEQRHLDRVKRIFPEALRNQEILSIFQATDSKGEPSGSSGKVDMDLFNLTGSLSSASIANKGSTITDPQQWLDGVRRSFRYARAVDGHYEKLVETVARAKLGLDCSDPAVMRFTRKFWCLLFEGTKKSQQRDIWRHICRFSYNYDGSRAAAEELEAAFTALELPQFHLWQVILQEYMDLLKKSTLASSDAALLRRKEQLQINERELDQFNQGGFDPDLQLAPQLRRVGKELCANRQSQPIFPVEVIPLYPAGFDDMAKENMAVNCGQGRSERLGEWAEGLHHVFLPGAVVNEDSKTGGPHVLVNNMELLVADHKGAKELEDGISVSYRALRENTFEQLVEDGQNTSSYLLNVCDVQGERTPAGLANADGRYIVYNRLAVRNWFVKAPNAETPPYEHYVVVFDADNGRKRQRDVCNVAEERHIPMQRVE